MKSEGICSYCNKSFSGSAMTKHLQSCADREKNNEKDQNNGKVYLIHARCDPFWIYFEVNSDSTLKEIDSFLRDLWLECCGHMSMFTIGGSNYSSSPQKGDGDKSMNIPLNKALSVGMPFIHEYDFGTTTTLGLKAVSEHQGKVKGISLIARNNLPDFKCKCGNPAKEICSQCVFDGEGFLCKKCAKEHECGEEMLLPYVNSPRNGMCGFTG
ncbi:MAG TPA: hypothetical protein DCL42_08330 [Deltaproteobacteria bacterium]|nr:hypothetical protein [Deltaproteobacteria bacterium]